MSDMLVRRTVQGDCIVYAWTSTTPVPSKRIRFIETSLILLRDAALAPKRTALMQFWYRINAEEDVSSDNIATSDGAAAELEMLKECGLRWRSNLSMGYLQSLEAMLVGGSAPSDPQMTAAIVPNNM